ncbi:MAG: Hint domain-containing protein [Pseudomonadota bacterium]
MAIGEAGTLTANTTTNNAPIRVQLTEPLTDPVIVMLGENSGGNRYVLRVLTDLEETNVDGDTTAFYFTLEEFENHDGPHPAVETVNWIAVEPGVHVLPDGRVIEAGEVVSGETPETVSLNGDFSAADPVILTTVNDELKAGGDVVDPDASNVSATGFTLELNQEEGQTDPITPEVVGYIAVQSGGGTDPTAGGAETADLESSTTIYDLVGAPYTNPIVVAETQTINDDDPGSVYIVEPNGVDDTSEIGLRFEEDTAAGGGGHDTETVGIVVFEQGLILCFAAGTLIDTPRGPVPVEGLRAGDPVLTKDNGPQILRWVGGKTLDEAALRDTPHLAPVIVPKGAFGPGVPSADLILSPEHRVLWSDPTAELMLGTREVLVPAKSLASSHSGLRGPVTYYHLIFDAHQIVRANGMDAESLHLGHLARDALTPAAREEIFTLFPDLRALPEGYGPACRRIARTVDLQLWA